MAVKVLPDAFATDADRIARFEREAKMLASLNHPNIASLFGMDQSDGTHFLVMELIEGDTIADRLRRGPVPVGEAVTIAAQIAEALEAAHECGVVHRDLKPANVKVTADGKVKVLDFGLAKAMDPGSGIGDQRSVHATNSPTLSMMATQAGLILGTAAYMSPEQAKGAPADARSDVFSFGCVLFEMLPVNTIAVRTMGVARRQSDGALTGEGGVAVATGPATIVSNSSLRSPAARGASSRVTIDGPQQHSGPAIWSPDGAQIAYGTYRSGKWAL